MVETVGTYTISRDNEDFQKAVDALMADPYDQSCFTREAIEDAAWEWVKSSIKRLTEDLVELTHGPSYHRFNEDAFQEARRQRGSAR